MSLLLALGAALCYAISSALQHRAAAAVPLHEAGTAALSIRLLRDRGWLAGRAADTVALVLQALALRQGSLVAVQAVLATGVLFALPLSTAMSSRRQVDPRDLVAAVVLVIGLAALLGVGQPSEGRFTTSLTGWLMAFVLIAGPTAVAILLAGNRLPWAALARAAGTGALFALDSAFLRATAHELGRVSVLDPAVLGPATGFAAAALGGNVLIQRAFQLAPLRVGLPALTVAEPVVGIMLGVILFGERFQGNRAAVVAAVGAAIAVAASAVLAGDEAGPPAGTLPDESAGSRNPADGDDVRPADER